MKPEATPASTTACQAIQRAPVGWHTLVLIPVRILVLSFGFHSSFTSFCLARVFGEGNQEHERNPPHRSVLWDGVPVQKPGSRSCAKLILLTHSVLSALPLSRGGYDLHTIQKENGEGKLRGESLNGVVDWWSVVEWWGLMRQGRQQGNGEKKSPCPDFAPGIVALCTCCCPYPFVLQHRWNQSSALCQKP